MNRTKAARLPRSKFFPFLLLLAGLAALPATGQGQPYQIRTPQLFPTSACCWTGDPSIVLLSFKSNRPASTVHSAVVEDGKLRITLRNPEIFEAGPLFDHWVVVDLPPVEQEGSLPVEVAAIDSPDDPEPQLLDTSAAPIAPLFIKAIPVKVLGVVPPHPGPDDEIQLVLDAKPSYPLAVIRGANQHVQLLRPGITWAPAPDGWPIRIGKLPAGDWRVVVETSAEVLIEVKEPAVDPPVGPALLAGGFEVEAAWSTAAGEQGPARLVQPPSRDSALFYFFSAGNWELMVKVLDGCAINGHYWVFGAASTDVGYTIDIRRQNSTQTYHYENPVGRTAPAITDIQAFPCEP